MSYSIKELAALAGVSTRTLRFYDQTGLLCPSRAENGYRVYDAAAVDKLQQILFYRALGFALDDIKSILSAPDYDRETALRRQLTELCAQRQQLDSLIRNVSKTLDTLKGDAVMEDHEKFEGLKEQTIRENEAKYGEEIRKAYGESVVDASNAKFKGMRESDWQRAQALNEQFSEELKRAMQAGDPAGEAAQKACALHAQWLRMYWPEGMYSKQAHRSLAEMYTADARFTTYYDGIEKGAAAFLLKALDIYCA